MGVIKMRGHLLTKELCLQLPLYHARGKQMHNQIMSWM